MRRAALATSALAVLAPAACDDVCDGPACAQDLPTCPGGDAPRLGLEHRWSIKTDEQANPEIVELLPGQTCADGSARAVVSFTDANRLSVLCADEDRLRFGESAAIDVGDVTSDLTAIVVEPGGRFAAITVSDYADPDCRSDAECIGGRCVPAPTAGDPAHRACSCLPPIDGVATAPGCACGLVIFVDVRPATFGHELGRIGVGWAPDSAAFSPDGRWLITADEDDRDIACKPGARNGGAVTILELGPSLDCPDAVSLGELGDVCRRDQVPTAWSPTAEPEDIAVTPDSTLAAITIQDSNELGFLRLPPGPAPAIERMELGRGVGSEEYVGPDGPAISPDGRWLLVSLENEGAVLVVDLSRWPPAITERHSIEDDLPTIYNRDRGSADSQIEPEQLSVVGSQGAVFVLVTLQESGALIAYRLDEQHGTLVFDSVQPVGLDYARDFHGTARGHLGPEGLAVLPATGGRRALAITANEREGTLTLFRASCPAP